MTSVEATGHQEVAGVGVEDLEAGMIGDGGACGWQLEKRQAICSTIYPLV